MSGKPQVFVALDEEELHDNLRMAEKIAEGADGLKLNDDAVDDSGLAPLIQPFRQFDRDLFIDMKMDKGQTRMARRALTAAELGVRYVNAFARCDRRLAGPVKALKETGCSLLAVTVLTHDTEDYCQKYFRRSLLETVAFLSDVAMEFECGGIILPGPTLDAVKALDTIKANTGIRPLWWKDRKANDQELTSTPREAVLGGASILIIGTPVTQSDDPVKALELVREEVDMAWAELKSGS